MPDAALTLMGLWHSFFSGLGGDGMTLRVELRLETAIILKNLASSCEQFFLLK